MKSQFRRVFKRVSKRFKCTAKLCPDKHILQTEGPNKQKPCMPKIPSDVIRSHRAISTHWLLVHEISLFLPESPSRKDSQANGSQKIRIFVLV
jgi:hypothetical protein